MLQGHLGDQVLDPVLARDLISVVDGVTKRWLDACAAGDCTQSVGPMSKTHPTQNDPYWAKLSLAHGRLVQRMGHDELRPHDFWVQGGDIDRATMFDQVGGPYFTKDPQGLSVSTVQYQGWHQQVPLMQAWLDAGPTLSPGYSKKTVIGWTLGAVLLGLGAAYLSTR